MAKNGKKSTSKMASIASSVTATVAAPCQGRTQTTCDCVATPTYEQISRRAQEIWKKKGCLPGQDEQNWLEAERQLMAELSRK